MTTTHQWPEDLMEIVHEPMGHTLDRMRRFSTSLSNVERAEAAAAAAAESERVDHQEKYKRTYREVREEGGALGNMGEIRKRICGEMLTIKSPLPLIQIGIFGRRAPMTGPLTSGDPLNQRMPQHYQY